MPGKHLVSFRGPRTGRLVPLHRSRRYVRAFRPRPILASTGYPIISSYGYNYPLNYPRMPVVNLGGQSSPNAGDDPPVVDPDEPVVEEVVEEVVVEEPDAGQDMLQAFMGSQAVQFLLIGGLVLLIIYMMRSL